MPRKSDTAPDSKEVNTSPPGKDKDKDTGISIDDHTLPKSIVTRLAKGVLPQNTNVQKDAVLALSKGGTVFINYLCATANDQAKQHGRKTINPKDVMDAMEILEFGDFLPRLEAELAKFNEIAEGKRANPRKPKDRDKASAAAARDPPNTGDGDSPPAAKKMRVGSGLKDAKGAAAGGKVEGEEDGESGDEEDEDDEEDDVPDDVPDDDATESDAEEEEEPEEALDAETEAEPEENGDREEDEALDNGLDSD